jgi:hypothetical protein
MPGYPKLEKYAPEQTESVDTLEKRFVGLTDTQIFLFSMPSVITLTLALLVLLDKRARQNPLVYVSLFLSGVHLYHHYTLTRLQNKIKQ